MNYKEIFEEELNGKVKAQDTLEELKLKWFIIGKEKKLKLLEYYIDKKEQLMRDVEAYNKKLK